ncbi:MAG: ATPase subunit of ABC transporter with duplicated ATPase domains, partial [Alteromonadaceae bacterium]
MFLKKIEIVKYRNFENTVIDFEKSDFPAVFSIASRNGAGKSTLLQFVFTLLHCFSDKDKHHYLQNLLADLDEVSESRSLARFVIEDKGVDHELEFIVAPAESSMFDFNFNFNFNLFLDLPEVNRALVIEQRKAIPKKEFLQFKEHVENSNRVTALLAGQLTRISSIIDNKAGNSHLLDLYSIAKNEGNIESYKKLVKAIYDQEDFSFDKLKEMEELVAAIAIKKAQAKQQLTNENLSYITHLADEKTVLLLKTKSSQDDLAKLSSKIYLTAPSSQIFLFLAVQDKQSIFNSFSAQQGKSYESLINDV